METQLQGLLDRAALGELINRYSAAIDQGDWALFRSCFTEQVEVDITDTPVGGAFGARSIAVDDWVKAVANGLADYSRTQHYSNNHVIDLSGDTATGVSSMLAMHFWPDGKGGQSSFKVGGHYQYAFVRTAAGWKISQCKISVTWQEGDSTRSISRYRAGSQGAADQSS